MTDGIDRHLTSKQEAEKNWNETWMLRRSADIIRILDEPGDGIEGATLWLYFRSVMSHQRYQAILETLKRVKLVEQRGSMWHWIGPRKAAPVRRQA